MAFDGTEVPAGVSAEADTPDRADVLYDEVRRELLGRATPLATYRVQLHRDFPFQAARAMVPYLARLGVTDLYCSPILAATPGSAHGYDCIDHSRLNPELGTEADYDALCEALRAHRLGQVLDVVPNHMGIERLNPLWFDVLENGPASLHARVFDIDWHPVKAELEDKVLLPILGDQYGVVLERGELRLAFRDGAFFIHYYDHVLPVAPRAYADVLSLDLDALGRELGEEDPSFVELQSILTAIAHLPPRTETDRARVVERNREKEVIKRRLSQVAAASPAVAAFIQRNVERFNGTPGEPRSFDRLDALLGRCSYRLAHWRVAGEEINYRRFFDINGLAAIRVEDPEVFNEAHQRVFSLLREGKVTGLRIDHPDGLFDPTAYFLRLQERFFLERARARLAEGEEWGPLERKLSARWRREVAASLDSPLRKALYVVVEKIQGGRERIPESWAVHGTTGYRFANAVGGLLVDPDAERALTETYERFVGERFDYERLVYEKKRLVMSASMASEINTLAHRLNRISEMNRRTRDFTLNSLRRALVEFIALFPVYRTYVDSARPDVDARDVQYIEWTIARAKKTDTTTNTSLYDFLRDILLRRYPDHLAPHERDQWTQFAMKLQQVTGPVMAKGLEDTVFYIYNRLVSLNEVGGEPERFGTRLETFHLRNQERAEHWPASQLTSSTHDTKRSEDVRARIHVLSELPEVWRTEVRRFSRLTARHRQELPSGPAPSPNDEYLFFQTVLGAWPMGLSFGDEGRGAEWASFRQRVRDYMLKAIKEAKVRTSWTNPDGAYDEAVARFAEAALDPAQSRPFLTAMQALVRRCERPGQVNGLSQLVLKLTSPGVVDTYQGCELWDLSLVDPDNRRPVDYGLRARMLEALDAEAAGDREALCQRLWAAPEDGGVKLYVLAEGLRLRRRRPTLFRRGGYRPLDVQGPAARHVVAFARELGEQRVVVVAPRFSLRLLEAEGGWHQALADTGLLLGAGGGGPWREVYSGRELVPRQEGEGSTLRLDVLWRDLPVALLEQGEPG